MIKPKMAEGSRRAGVTVIDDCGGRVFFGGKELIVEDEYHEVGCNPLDAIRALVEGGKLELWSAAVNVARDKALLDQVPDSACNRLNLQESLTELCRVVDEMKEEP